MEFACNEDKGSWKEISVGRRLSKSLLSKTVEWNFVGHVCVGPVCVGLVYTLSGNLTSTVDVYYQFCKMKVNGNKQKSMPHENYFV